MTNKKVSSRNKRLAKQNITSLVFLVATSKVNKRLGQQRENDI